MAEQERFELSHQLTRSTPLAGAPLQPLEYCSILLLQKEILVHSVVTILQDFVMNVKGYRGYFCKKKRQFLPFRSFFHIGNKQ